MDELPGILARDFGFRPQGKSAPMAASKAASAGGVNLDAGMNRSSEASSSLNRPRSGPNPTSAGDPFLGDHRFKTPGSRSPPGHDDIFGGPPSYSNKSSDRRSVEGLSHYKSKSSSSLPVYDKPVHDDDAIFDGVPGLKSTSAKYDDIFSSVLPASKHDSTPPYDDLLENLGKPMPAPKNANEERSGEKEHDLSGFDELIPGFGGSSPPKKREPPEVNQQKPSVSSAKPASIVTEDPFVVLETESTSTSSSGFILDPLENISMPLNSENMKVGASSVSGGSSVEIDSFGGLSKSMPASMADINESQKNKGYTHDAHNMSPGHHFSGGQAQQASADAHESILPKMHPPKSSDSQKFAGVSGVQSSATHGRNTTVDQTPKSYEQSETADDVWLTVDEIPLFTQPSGASPPSRPPPPFDTKKATSADNGKREKESLSQPTQSYTYTKDKARKPVVSPIDELEDFAMGKPQTHSQDHADIFTRENNIEANSDAAASAAAMKEAVDRAEVKFRHARGLRERERNPKSTKSRVPVWHERVQKAKICEHDVEDKENQERIYKEQQQKEWRRIEKERKKEQARQAAERATREVQERSAAEGRLKAEKAAAGIHERAAAEARERAAAEARDKAAGEKQQKPENDLESFFSMGTQASSSPKQRATVESMFDVQSQSKGGYDGTRTSSSFSSTIRKASSTTNIVDDLSSIFGAPQSSGEFQEAGESEERRKARLERHQRTLERAAKALAEKNERDMQIQREQAERQRIAEALDFDIKRWASGKEGNLRALLSTLQYVVWPECSWQPVSLTDLITAAAVKKVYRKATLCLHPDKVQQKGANLQQKYIAEKVFDLLKPNVILATQIITPATPVDSLMQTAL
nr:PREDICTED: auxilin-related protein 2-like isoform X1 [Musa acuminata subsp. malaccensis]